MLEPGSVVSSPRGTVVEILENRLEHFAIKRTLPPRTGKTASHRHENGIERFRVIEGRATGSVDGQERTLGPGDAMEVPRNTAHVHPHTDDSTTAVIEHVIEPRPEFVAIYFASWLTWLREGRVDRQEEPGLLQIMAVLHAGGGGTWVTGPPVAAQRALAAALSRVASARGYRTVAPPGI